MAVSEASSIVRPYRQGDEAAINDGFNRAFGLTRPLAEWQWKFPDEPDGRWIMLAEEPGGRLLAHYGATPMRTQVDDLMVRAGQPVDVYSLPEARRSKVFTRCYETFISAFGNPHDLPLMYGFPGGVHYEMGLTQLSYVPMGAVGYWRREARLRRGVWLPRYRLASGFDAVAVDSLWDRVRGRYPVAGVRDAAWIGRRFAGRPGVDYVHLTVWQQSRPAASAVVRVIGKTLRWADLLWDGDDPRALVELDLAVDTVARKAGCTLSEFWLRGDEATAAALASLGWVKAPHPEDLRMVARAFHPALDLTDIARRFYMTMGDSDLV